MEIIANTKTQMITVIDPDTGESLSEPDDGTTLSKQKKKLIKKLRDKQKQSTI